MSTKFYCKQGSQAQSIWIALLGGFLF